MDAIVEATREAKRWIEDLEPKERARLGIKNDKGLRVDYTRFLATTSRFRTATPTASRPTTFASRRWLLASAISPLS